MENATKAQLRRSLLKQRQALTDADWRTKSDQLCKQLQATSLFAQAQTILAYFSVRQEPDLSSLFHLKKTWGFPRCVGQQLEWHGWSPEAGLPLQVGAFGIREPHPDAPKLSVEQVDLILVPAIACNRQGYRLGYGGGYYDRLLRQADWNQKPTIGILFEFGCLPSLPIDAWDQPLLAICTEGSFHQLS